MMYKRAIFICYILLLLLNSCSESTTILEGHDFSKGNWLLVNEDDVKGTLEVIDDENVLANNTNGIKVKWDKSHEFTTCDGWLRLYKDGELIARQNYLEASYLSESSEIRTAYKKGSEHSIHPKNKIEFNALWDSLSKIKNCYPSRNHIQPEDIDIIVFFKHD